MFVKFFFVMDLMKLGKIKEHQSQSCSLLFIVDFLTLSCAETKGYEFLFRIHKCEIILLTLTMRNRLLLSAKKKKNPYRASLIYTLYPRCIYLKHTGNICLNTVIRKRCK